MKVVHKSASALLITPNDNDPVLNLAKEGDIWLRQRGEEKVFFVKVNGEWIQQNEKGKTTT